MFLNLVLVSFLKNAANTPSEVTTPTPRHINIASNHASLQQIVKLVGCECKIHVTGERKIDLGRYCTVAPLIKTSKLMRVELMRVMKTHKLIMVM